MSKDKDKIPNSQVRPERRGKSLRVSLLAAIILVGCTLADGQEKRTDLTAGSIEISLVLPRGLEPFPEWKMAEYRERGGAGDFIYSDKQADLTLLIHTYGSEANEKRLPQIGDQIKATTEERGSAVEGLTRRFIKINGKKWLQLSFQEKPADSRELMNDYFVTDWIGKYVLLVFTSPTARHENFKGAVQRSARSIQLGFIAELTVSPPNTNPAKTKP